MKSGALIFIFLAFWCMAGCESIPFQKMQEEEVMTADPLAVAENFRNAVPGKYGVLNTVVFEYKWKKFSGLGIAEVDTAEKICRLVCTNPLGIKLFEMVITRDDIDTHFALPEFTSRGDFSKIVGDDIRRIYFDLVPSDKAVVVRKKTSIIFRQAEGDGVLEYVFAGRDKYLSEKAYYEKGKPIWRVSFYEYRQKEGKAYPGGTIMKSYRYGYRLVIRLKEVTD